MALYFAQTDARPLRYAFVLPPDAPARTFNAAVRVACALWGGIYSIFVLAETGTAEGSWRLFMKQADPDVVVMFPNSRGLRGALPAVVTETKIEPHDVVLLKRLKDLGSAVVGYPAGPAYDQIYRRAEPSDMPPLVDPTQASAFTLADAAIHGIPLAAAPEQMPIELITPARYRVLKKQGVKPEPTTAVELSATAGARRRDPRARSPIIYLGSPRNLADVCAFWSLRALRGGGVEWRTLNLASLDQLATVSPRTIFTALDEHLRKTLETAGALQKARWSSLRACIRSSGALEWSRATEGALFEGDQGILMVLAPDTPWRLPRGARWALDVSLTDPNGVTDSSVRLPRGHSIGPLLSRTAADDKSIDARVTNWGFSFAVSSADRFRPKRLMLPSPQSIIEAIAHNCGWKVELSDKGNYMRRAVELAGGLPDLAQILRYPLAREILDEFMRDHHTRKRLDGGKQRRRYLSLADMTGIASKGENARSGGARKRDAARAITSVRSLAKHLLGAGILQAGAIFDCPRCKAEEWYHASEFAESYRCRRCLVETTCGPEPEWRYRLHESLFQAHFHNFLVPVLALDWLRTQAETSFSFLPECVFTDEQGRGAEVDLVCLRDGRLIVGEAKSGSGLDLSTISRYAEFARQMGAWAICFATTGTSNASCLDGSCGDCLEKNTRNFRPSDDAFSHGEMTGPSQGCRERIWEIRAQLQTDGIAVETLCPGRLFAGSQWRPPGSTGGNSALSS